MARTEGAWFIWTWIFPTFFQPGYIEAIHKITGANVAFTRPRKFQISVSRCLLDLGKPFFFVAYGEYNDLTIQVANDRKQTLVNWDFECELISVRRLTFSFTYCFFFPSMYVAREIR